MSEFVNTVDIVGDEALANSIIDRSITELKDDISTTIALYAFYNCTALTSVNFPNVTSVGTASFRKCTSLAKADFGSCVAFSSNIFQNCSKLSALILRDVAAVSSLSGNLSGTLIASGTGYIYVPRALVDSYKAATNWSTYAAQIRAIEDYPGVCDPYTWEGVFANIDDGSYASVYSVGDLVPLDLGSEGIIDMQIVAFDSDDKSDGSGKAAISWIGKQVLATKVEMNPALVSNDDGTYQEGTGTIGGWEKSTMRLHLQNTIMPIVPTLLLNNIKEVVKEHLAYNESGAKYTQTTNEKIWIPAQQEIDVTLGSDYKEIQPKYSDLLSDNVFVKKGANWGMRNAIGTGEWRGASQTFGSIYTLTSGVSVGVVLCFCT